MKTAAKFALVLITAPDLKTARALARVVLRRRLAACVNLVPRIESHYWWRGKIERGGEVLLVAKTARARLAALEEAILGEHPYDTPEIVSVSLSSGSPRYLAWIAESVAA